MMDWLDKKTMVAAHDRGDHAAFAAVVDRDIAAFTTGDWEVFLSCLSLVDESDIALCRRHAERFLDAERNGTFRYISFGAAFRAEICLERLREDAAAAV